MDFSVCSRDGGFGPSIKGCRGDFDFTMTFERLFFSIVPSAIFITISAPRILLLFRRHCVVQGTWFQYTKLMATIVYATIELALLVVGITRSRTRNALFVSSSVLGFAAGTCIAMLSFVEHSRSPRPSILLNGFLFLTILFDAVQTRSIWLSAQTEDARLYASLFTTSIVWKTVLILTESYQKRRWLRWDLRDHSPEEMIGLYGLSTLFWLNPLLLAGYSKVLSVSDLFALDRKLTAETLLQSSLRLDASHFKGRKLGLARALARALAVPFLIPVASRLALILFSICQVLLFESLLDYLGQPADAPANTGYGLIGATVIVYLGMPIATSLHGWSVQRALLMTRSCLVPAIYRKTTQAHAVSGDDVNALTLMSIDVERIQMGLESVHEFWAIPLQGAVASWLLYRQLGAAFASPLVLIAVCTVASVLVVGMVAPRQMAWMSKIEQRVWATVNVVGNMKNIKLSGLARPVEIAVQEMRMDDLAMGNKFRSILLLVDSISYMPGLLAAMFTFAVTSRTMDVTTIFTSAAYLSLLADPLMNFFQAAPELVAALTCFQRVQRFLEQDGRRDFRCIQDPTATPDGEEGVSPDKDSSVVIRIVNGNFGWAEDKMVLRDISATVVSGLTMIVGPVASGKSTLCRALLGEIPFAEGDVFVGSRFARIGFCDQTPFLMNGTLRDNIVGFLDFDERRYADVIDATMLRQDLPLLPQDDQSGIGSNGIALSGGQKQRVSIARALYQRCDMYIFDDVLSGLDTETEQHVFTRIFGPQGLLKQRNTPAVLCTQAVRHLRWADSIIALAPDGGLVEEGTFTELVANEQYVHSLGVHLKGPDAEPAGGMSARESKDPVPTAPTSSDKTELAAEVVADVDPSRALGDTKVFIHYFKSVGALWLTVFSLLGIICAAVSNFSTVWLKYWSSDTASASPERSTSFYVGIYSLLQCLAFASVIGVNGIGMLIIIKFSGSRLHQAAIRTVMAAPLQFFTTTDTGVVTNLFSQDINILDNELPLSLANANIMLWLAIGSAAVAATSSPYILVSYPFIGATVFAIQKFYLRTSRQLRLLDLEMKSPLYSNFIDTMKGVVTFRAFGWMKDTIPKNNVMLNMSQRPAYLLRMVQRWLALVLGLVVAALAVLLVTLSIQLRANPGFTGASMLSIMTFGKYIAAIIHNYTLLETSIGAVSRIKTFSETTSSEDLPGEDVIPPSSWPEKGAVEIKNVSASFSVPEPTATDGYLMEKKSNLALQCLTMKIDAGQKVAICGRTGSGKSSVILLLLRLLNPLSFPEYGLTIDGLSLDRVDRTTLRERIIVVPQEPVFLPDGTTFKRNLDPTETAPEEECHAALQAVGLWDLVQERGGLSVGLTIDSLSQGQRQLFSLAKAILRRRLRSSKLEAEVGKLYLDPKSKTATEIAGYAGPETETAESGSGLLIMDEFSSNLDPETDRLMQEIIFKEFRGYTMIMVTHRLGMVMRFDQVVVLDAGTIVEQGKPKDLVQQEGSRFRELWKMSE